MADEALTIEQAAERLKVSPKTVRRMVTSRRLPAVKIGRQWRVSSAVLDAVLRGEINLEEDVAGRAAALKKRAAKARKKK